MFLEVEHILGNYIDIYSHKSFFQENSHSLENTISGIMPSREFPDPFPLPREVALWVPDSGKCPFLPMTNLYTEISFLPSPPTSRALAHRGI